MFNNNLYNDIMSMHREGFSSVEISEVLGVYEYVVKSIID